MCFSIFHAALYKEFMFLNVSYAFPSKGRVTFKYHEMFPKIFFKPDVISQENLTLLRKAL